jgi:hypothetical protein
LDSHPLDERPRPNKWQIEAKPTWHHFGGKFNWFRPKTKTKRKGAQMKACDSENQDARALESQDQKVANRDKTYIKPF